MQVTAAVLGSLFVIIFMIRSSFFNLEGVSKSLIIGLLIIKILGSYVIVKHYDKQEDRRYVDIYKYYDDGLKLKNGISKDLQLLPLLLVYEGHENTNFKKVTNECSYWYSSGGIFENRGNRLMLRINALLAFVTFENYFLHSLFFSLLSFIGILLIVKTIPIENKFMKTALFITLICAPSLLFWTSGILKESLLIFLLGSLVYSIINNSKSPYNFIRISIIISTLILIYFIKPYIVICLFPSVIFLALIKLTKLSVSWKALTTLGICLVAFLLINPLSQINEKRNQFTTLAEAFDAQSTYDTPVLNSPFEIIWKGPLAFTNTIFRPSFFELNKKSYIPFALEGLFLFTLIVIALLTYSKQRKLNLNFIWASIFFFFSLGLIIGLTVPIFGASVRYRAPVILFVLVVIFQCIEPEKISNFLKLKNHES